MIRAKTIEVTYNYKKPEVYTVKNARVVLRLPTRHGEIEVETTDFGEVTVRTTFGSLAVHPVAGNVVRLCGR